MAARRLARQKIAKAVRLAAGDSPPDDNLPDGHMRLYSFYKPSLEAGLYGIEARQKVVDQRPGSTDSALYIWNHTGGLNYGAPPLPPTDDVEKQKFEVAAPQFNLDSKLINTFYPPSGHEDEARILPHIVFNDPHVPWYRKAGVYYDWLAAPVDSNRNMVPWLAVIVFDAEDLAVTPPDAAATGLATVASYNPAKLPEDGSFPMSIGDYLTKIPDRRTYYQAGYKEAASQNDWEDLTTSTDVTSVIFPTKGILQQIFGKQNDSADFETHLQNQKYLAHVRHIKTTGFPDAGVDEDGYYSVLISARTGQLFSRTNSKLENTLPVSQIVHVVSLEHLDSTMMDPNSPVVKLQLGDTDRIGMVSLYSWTYTCIPEPVNFVDTMKDLAANMQPLKPPQSVLDAMSQSINTQPTKVLQQAASMLQERLDRGYTISRWRAATGEETVAFNRGPLVPALMPEIPAKDVTTWPALSMNGKDYQIYDKDLGVVDLTYSTAWSLGRLAAISDSPFNAALLRFRSRVWQQAASTTRMSINGVQSAGKVLASTSASIEYAASLQPDTFSGTVTRINPSSTDPVAPPLTHPDVAPVFAEAIRIAVDSNASNADGAAIYSDLNLDQATNSDWELIHGWLSDSLYFKNIPAHYLFPEPSHIQGPQVLQSLSSAPNTPPEALRFFFIDEAWMDCFIDGALSCGNHLEPKYDSTRMRIKDVYNFYLSEPVHGLEGITPPVPRSGFVLRSSVVKALPDLRITVTVVSSTRDPVLQLTKHDDFTLFCLLDCLPTDIQQLKISQPPHQQRYAIGDAFVPQQDGTVVPELLVRMLYTSAKDAPEGNGDAGIWPNLPSAEQPKEDQYYKQDTRCIQPGVIASSVNTALLNSKTFPNMYEDLTPNSCILGLELNDPSYSLVIENPSSSNAKPSKITKRKLFTGHGREAQPHQPQAEVSTKRLISTPSTRVNVLPLAASVPKMTNQPSPLRLNSTRIVSSLNPSHTGSIHSAATGTTAAGVNMVPGPQFTLIVHPDYRPPPPTPLSTGSSLIYAPFDFVPTETNYLYDLIIAIRRKDPDANPGYQLLELHVEFPVADGTETPSSGREPLLPKGGYTGPGVHMVSNPRFVPLLYHTKVSGKPVLGVKLIPRSSNLFATITIANDERTSEASVCLAQCPIAQIFNTAGQVSVAQVDSHGNGTGKGGMEYRAIVNITLTEVYHLADGSTQNVITNAFTPGIPPRVLKKAGGDKDLNGNDV